LKEKESVKKDHSNIGMQIAALLLRTTSSKSLMNSEGSHLLKWSKSIEKSDLTVL